MTEPWVAPNPKAMSDWEVNFALRQIEETVHATTYLEIGSRAGGSLWHFGRMLPQGSLLVSVEMRLSHKRLAKSLTGVCQYLRRLDYRVEQVTGDSHDLETVARVAAVTLSDVDVLFIDGDHTDQGVRADVKNYVPLVRPGGLVIFHDCGDRNSTYVSGKPGAQRLMDDVRKVFMEFVSDKRYVVAQEQAGLGFVRM